MAAVLALALMACSSGKSQQPFPAATGGSPAASNPLPTLPSLYLLMDGPIEARAGDVVTLRVTVKNGTGGTFGIELGGDYPANFAVHTGDGTPVWWLTYGKAIRDFAIFRTMAADEEITFEASWNLTDNSGKPLPPGYYVARATLDVDYPFKLETEQSLTIKP